MLSIDTLVITGSNGFVGQSLLEFINKLSSSGRPKRIVTINRTDYSKIVLSSFPDLNIDYRVEDLRLPWQFDVPNAHLINLAADGSQNAYSEEASNLFTTIGLRMSEWIRKNRPLSLFHASSGASFGVVPLETMIDNSEHVKFFNRKDRFIESRLKVERNLTSLAEVENIKIVIGRLFSFVGPNILKKDQYAISSFVHDAVKKGKISVNGNPNTVRSYLHENDMSSWILKSLLLNEQVSRLSIGSSIKVQISDLAEFIAQLTNADLEYLNPKAPGDIYVADNTSTLERLKVTESKNWQDAVVECVQIAKESKN